MMNEIWFQIGTASGLGIGLGWLYFGALWLTVQRSLEKVSALRAASIVMLSYMGRLALALAVFYWLATWSFVSLAAGVVSFTLMAFVLAMSKVSSGTS